jgi:hypothetical protein
MARYKVLKSVAHSLVHSFTSLINYRDDDYVLGHILRRSRETGQGILVFDVLTAEAAPASLLTPPIVGSIEGYRKWFPDLVTSHKTSMDVIRAAKVTLTFDLDARRPARLNPKFEESPYRCVAEITDDRGKVWSAAVSDWWYPEAGEIPASDHVTERLVSRLGQIIRTIWQPRR